MISSSETKLPTSILVSLFDAVKIKLAILQNWVKITILNLEISGHVVFVNSNQTKNRLPIEWHISIKCVETNSYHQQQDSGNWAFCFKLLNIEIRFVTILAGIHQSLRRQQAPAKPINGFNQYRPRHTNVFILCRSVSLIFPSLTRSCFHSQASQDPPGGACVTFPWTRWECQLASNLETKQWKHLVRQIQNNDNNVIF